MPNRHGQVASGAAPAVRTNPAASLVRLPTAPRAKSRATAPAPSPRPRSPSCLSPRTADKTSTTLATWMGSTYPCRLHHRVAAGTVSSPAVPRTSTRGARESCKRKVPTGESSLARARVWRSISPSTAAPDHSTRPLHAHPRSTRNISRTSALRRTAMLTMIIPARLPVPATRTISSHSALELL
uniref:Uncharacterized protein n=1 Tax=Cacopsylla melanoneura TaxID=428564 RepID=A0A8D8UIE7_9HEMI